MILPVCLCWCCLWLRSWLWELYVLFLTNWKLVVVVVLGRQSGLCYACLIILWWHYIYITRLHLPHVWAHCLQIQLGNKILALYQKLDNVIFQLCQFCVHSNSIMYLSYVIQIFDTSELKFPTSNETSKS